MQVVNYSLCNDLGNIGENKHTRNTGTNIKNEAYIKP